MTQKKLKIRKIVFGIRFKFSIIIILAVAFVSVLIGFNVINQHEVKMQDSLKRQGSIILNGIADQAEIFSQSGHLLNSPSVTPISPVLAQALQKRRAESLIKMSGYFSTIIGKELIKLKEERFLDIAFIIDINWHDMDVDWKRYDQSKYYYFDRITGNPYVWQGGVKEPLLEPTIFSHYMSAVNTEPYVIIARYTDFGKQYEDIFKKQNYIIVGIPLFNDKTDIYDRYLTFKNSKGSLAKYQILIEKKSTSATNKVDRLARTQESLLKYIKDKNSLPTEFLDRIIKNGVNLDYTVELKTEKQIEFLTNFLLSRSVIAYLNPAQKKELISTIKSMLYSKIIKEHISATNIQLVWSTANKKFRLALQPKIVGIKFHQDCYLFLVRNDIPVISDRTLDELATISFRKDIAGVLGLFIHRNQYFPDIIKNRNIVINLMVSIFLRAIFLALLFPTFIIRSITRLADGAVAIGKGDFDKQIIIHGTDEIGRLSDIFNIMTTNLKKAQEVKIEKMRMERELITAQQIQSALLPESLPHIKGMEFAAYYSAQTESGGDYYDFIDLGAGRLGITIADVSGHGVGSGLVMAMTRTLLHTYSQKILNTKKIFETINDYLKTNTASNYFVTMFYGILNTETFKLSYSSAGHCQPILIRDGRIRQLPAGGIALGASSNEMFLKLTDIKEIQLQKGDYFIQYTDGIDEAMNESRQEYGLERFQKSLLDNSNKSPEDLVKSVIEDIKEFTVNIPQHDDITMIVFRIR
jgi:serine phosphatase RsbU (regulator of sigma subunit)